MQSADSRRGFISDYNVVNDANGFSNNDIGQNLAEWRASTGQDLHSIVATPVQLFVNVSAGDYHLLASSAAINAGTSGSAPANDLDGFKRPSKGGWDIGAYEYQLFQVPVNVLAKPISGSIDVSWTDTNRGLTNTVVYRHTGSGACVKVGAVSAGKTKFREATAQAGVMYFYRVYAYSAAGTSNASATTSAMIPA